ncbi:DUF4349 domain-containing protein [Actinoplanes sp. NPDC051851]|uniref:DUF4349 domain-containing protein n=1 Tax=Actinoplanes sp. NPDC051851 TaxID=3154753 RepID=UPI003429252E
MRKRGYTAIGAVAVCGALMAGLAGCGADGGSDSSAVAPAKGAAEDAGGAVRQDAAGTEGNTAEGKDTAAEAPDLSVDQRSIVYTGSITIRVKDVNVAAAQATGIAAGAGGFIGGDERHSGDEGAATATMTLRIPAAKFTTSVDQIAKLGDEESRGITTEDVTEQVVDLDARIAVQQARVASGRKLLGQAESLNDLVMLEKEVATRESDLASLQAKKRKLADLAALSTITVVLLGPEAAVVEPEEDPAGFLAGLEGGWKALIVSLTVLLTVLGALLPWIVAVGLPAWGIWHFARRYRRRGEPAAETADSPTPVS